MQYIVAYSVRREEAEGSSPRFRRPAGRHDRVAESPSLPHAWPREYRRLKVL
jgi:hypothetical protein